MNSRERVLTVLNHREADRVPFNFTFTTDLKEQFRRRHGTLDFAGHYGQDIQYVDVMIQTTREQADDREHTPLVTPETRARCCRETQAHHERGFAVASEYESAVFEKLKHWYGDARVLMMPYDEPELLEKEIARLVAWRQKVFAAYADIGVDILWFGDDLGAQKDLIMSPEQYRQWYKPAHAAIIRHVKKIRPDIKVALHSCGCVVKLLPDFIDIGLDILQAVQPECMDLAFLKKEYGRHICFWGGLGEQSVMAHGGPSEVEKSVRETLAIMGPGGGFILAPAHRLTADVPWKNVETLAAGAPRLGRYPLPQAK